MKRIIIIMIAVVTLFMLSIVASAEDTSEIVSDETIVFDETKIGDVNNDGKRNASDARLILRVSAHIEASSEYILMYGDYNKDNVITASDARTALRVSAHLENIECIIYGHSLEKVIIPPTCTEAGFTTNACIRCVYTDGTKEDFVKATGHDYKLTNTVKATCASEGYNENKCTKCNDVKKTNIVPALSLICTPKVRHF